MSGSSSRTPGQQPPSSSPNTRYRYPEEAHAGQQQQPQQPSSYSAPYRLANAAAAAASPLLGYLSGHGSGIQQQQDGSTIAPTASTSARRASTMTPYELSAAAALSGSPASNMPPHSTTSTTHHQRVPSAENPQYRYSQSRTPSTSSNTPTPIAQNMRRTSSISDEDARKKESRNLDSIVLQVFSKAAQVITQARFTHVSMTPSSGAQDPTSRGPSTAPKKSRNRWFNLELEESDIFKDELRTWRSVTNLLSTPTSTSSSISETASLPSDQLPLNYANVPKMVIEIILDVSDISPNQVLVLNNTKDGKRFRVDLSGKGRTTHLHNPTGTIEGSPKKCNIVLERWTLSMRPPPPPGPLELPTVYKHCIILFRALYTLVRTLPIFELHRKLKRRTGRSEIKIGCRLSTEDVNSQSASDTTSLDSDAEQEGDLEKSEIGLDTPLGNEDDASFSILDFAFAPVITPVGSLDLRCRYRACVDFSVEEIEALLSSRFIDEDFFKPTMRKYSSSGPGSVPTRLGGTSPLQAYSRSQQKQPPVSLSVGRSVSQPQPVPTSISPSGIGTTDEGAFVSHSKGKAPEMPARTVSASPSDMSRRPSIGGSHPFKPTSASPSQINPRSFSTPPVDPSAAARYSGSPASVGPSSSLRYAVGITPRSLSGTGTPGPSVSQLSYTKRSIPSPTNTQPPISALTAMNLGTSPSPPDPILPGISTTQPMPVPGTSAIPLSSSPTPSLIKRYSTSRYSRSFGQGSSGSSPGEYHGQGFWGPESLGRRSRLSSGQSREDMQPSGSRLPLNATSPSAGDAPDADQIKSFLGMIDSRAQLPGGSVLLGGSASPSRALNKSTVLNRLNAEEKLRNLADSVMRGSPARSTSSTSSQSTSAQNTRPPSTTNYAQTHMRRRSGEFVASMPTSSRQTPSPDMYSASPVDNTHTRPRISQPPMSTSIPEEEARHSRVRPQNPPRSESSSLTNSNPSSHFPFPRYVSTSMRRRGSSQSSTTRPVVQSPSVSGSRGHSPMQRSAGDGSTPENAASSSSRGQGESDGLEASGSPSIGGAASIQASQSFDGGEEQAVAQLELGGNESIEDVRRYDRHRLPEPPRDYRWGRHI